LARFDVEQKQCCRPASKLRTVLAAFCQLAASLPRPADLFGRIGGDEFASLLPNTERQVALLLAERLRAAFQATSHIIGERTVAVTVSSIGVAISEDANSDLGALLEAADRALYRVKALGRSCLEVSTHPAEPSPKRKRTDVSSAAQ
jgi:diguanylate cyclase (GGDEF)-like protein